MARGKKQIDGQLVFDFCIEPRNYVVQANTLIGGKQALKINSAKLIRSAIMQVVYEDQDLKPYVISIDELSKLLGVSKTNLYRDIDDITDDIIKNPVYIRVDEADKKKTAWVKIPWVSICEYHSDVGVAIQLNEKLKPYLLNLKEHYTQYALENILAMKSVYAIRIFELLQEKIKTRKLPVEGVDIELSVEQIKICCDCEDKYAKFSHFKDKVLDVAVREINNQTLYTVSYNYIKKGRSVVGIRFHVNMYYHIGIKEEWSKRRIPIQE